MSQKSILFDKLWTFIKLYKRSCYEGWKIIVISVIITNIAQMLAKGNRVDVHVASLEEIYGIV